MKRVIVLKGLPASGKTRWAQREMESHPGVYVRVSRAELLEMLGQGEAGRTLVRLATRQRDALILEALEAGRNVIVDDQHLDPAEEQEIRELVAGKGEVEVRFFEADVEDAVRRDRKRPKPVGAKVIRRMHREHLASPPQVYEGDPSLPPAVICDLDGTLALLNGRNPYDAARCERDLLNPAVASILAALTGVEVLLVSGREDRHRPQTERWLKRHEIRYAELHMRKTRDHRKDTVVKREIFEREIRERFNIQFVLDDRDQVVEMWRSLGLTCLQVAEGDF